MSLAEVLVTMVLMLLLLFAVVQLLDTTSAIAPKDRERNDVLHEAQVGLHRMTRELRQSFALNSSPQTASRMSAQVTVAGVDKHVLYDCNLPSPTKTGFYACRRVAVNASGAVPTNAASGEVVIDRLTTPNIFTYTPSASSPKYVKAKIQVPAAGERTKGYAHTVTLDDGFFMRNLSLL